MTGAVRMKFHKGSCAIVGRKSPYSLYSFKLATYDKGDIFDQGDSAGFIRLWVQTKVQAQEQLVGPAKSRPLKRKALPGRKMPRSDSRGYWSLNLFRIWYLELGILGSGGHREETYGCKKGGEVARQV